MAGDAGAEHLAPAGAAGMASGPLHAEHLAPAAGAPRRGVVVLVHGFTQTRRSWAPIAAPLAAAGHPVVLVDAPGHGGSSGVRVDLVRGAELLGQAGGRATYVGYSMGARLGLHLALGRPDLVEALILLGATAGIDDTPERAARRAADDALAADLERDGVDAFLTRWLANPLFAHLPAAAAGLEDRRGNTAAGLASSLRLAGTGTQAPLWDRLSSLACPTLVVAGALDAKFAALGRRLVAGIGTHARLALIPGAGHAAHLEQPGAFLAELAPFVAAVARP